MLRFVPLLLCLLCAASSLAQSFTVQVIALSDQEMAFEQSRALQAKGYLTYIFSVPTAQGTVYRLRIGKFADRASAQAFADAVAETDELNPVPALAEGIPTGLVPLEPELLVRAPYDEALDVKVVPWGESYALRLQQREPLGEAFYYYGQAEPLQAWRANATEAGIWRLHSFPLGEDDTRLNLAESFQLSPDILDAFRFRHDDEIVLLTVEFIQGEARSLRPALGNPFFTFDTWGADPIWFNQVVPEDFPSQPEVSYQVPALSQDDLPDPTTLQLTGNDWQAQADGPFVGISLQDSEKTWRSLAGYPLWAQDEYILVYSQGELLLYAFRRP